MKLKVIVSLILFLGIAVNAAQPIEQVSESVAMVEYMAKQEALSLAPIKSKGDLNRVLKKNSAIDYLSPTAKEIILNSLVFGSNGLASFNYTVVKDELDPDQSYQLLALFGVQHLIRDIYEDQTKILGTVELDAKKEIDLKNMQPFIRKDYNGYYCKSRATCAKAISDICIGGNC